MHLLSLLLFSVVLWLFLCFTLFCCVLCRPASFQLNGTCFCLACSLLLRLSPIMFVLSCTSSNNMCSPSPPDMQIFCCSLFFYYSFWLATGFFSCHFCCTVNHFGFSFVNLKVNVFHGSSKMSSSLSDFVLSIRLFIFSSSLSTRSVIHDYGDNLQHSAGKVNSNNNGALCIQQWGEAAVFFHGLGFRSQNWVLTSSSH